MGVASTLVGSYLGVAKTMMSSTQRRRDEENFLNTEGTEKTIFFSQPQISQIRGIFSLALVIEIPKIPNICGFVFAR